MFNKRRCRKCKKPVKKGTGELVGRVVYHALCLTCAHGVPMDDAFECQRCS